MGRIGVEAEWRKIESYAAGPEISATSTLRLLDLAGSVTFTRLATDVAFVHLDNAVEEPLLVGIGQHRRSDPQRQRPRRFVG